MAQNPFIRTLLRLVAALTLSATMVSAAPLDQWHWRSPLPQGNPLRSVTYENGLYVAVGDLGTILTSTDATNWVRQISGTTLALRDCAYGAGQWVVVGDFGTVLTSPDGRSWTPRYCGTFFSLNAVTFGNGQFVAVGNGATILTSPDGTIWTPRSSGPLDLFEVLYEEGVYVAAGRDAGFAGIVLSSADGVVWIRTLSPNGTVSSVAYGAGRFAATTQISSSPTSALWISEDGHSWRPGDIDVRRWPDARLGYGGGTWVLAGSYNSAGFGGGAIAISSDLEAWVEVVSNAPVVSAISYQPERFVVSCTDGAFLVSSDGRQWNNPNGEYSRDALYDLQFVPNTGGWLALGHDRLLGSADGARWTNVIVFTNQSFDDFTYANGVAVAANYWYVWTSSDLVNWTNVTDAFSGAVYPGIVDMTFGGGLFVAISSIDGGVFASTDGSTWSRSSVITPDVDIDLLSIAYGGGRFVAVGPEGFATSADGTNWYGLGTNSINMSAVTWGDGRFVAVGPYGSMTTTDGTNWVSQRVPQFGASAVAFGGGYFVAVGSDYLSKSESPIWVSGDGLNWSYRSSQTLRSFRSVAFGNGIFVVGGSAGTVLHSAPIVNLKVQINSEPQLTLSGPAGRSYRIDCADGAPGVWRPLRTLFMDDGSMTFTDPHGGDHRFYRAELLP